MAAECKNPDFCFNTLFEAWGYSTVSKSVILSKEEEIEALKVKLEICLRVLLLVKF